MKLITAIITVAAAAWMSQGLADSSFGSSLPNQFQTNGENTFVFSPKAKAWGAYDADGYLVASGVANGGADYCAELGRPCHTPVGSYRVMNKGSAACKSSRYPLPHGGAPMPYCMHFTKAGHAIHGSPYVGNKNSSHGCIRVRTESAAWLSKYFIKSGTKVVVLPY